MINKLITELIEYGKIHLDLSFFNAIYASNQLLEIFNADEFNRDQSVDLIRIEEMNRPDEILDRCLKFLSEKAIINESQEDMIASKIMGIISPSPDAVIHRFNEIYQKNPHAASDYLYHLGIKNFYIKKTAIEKNLLWQTQFKNKNFNIAINISKPEKDNKEIAKLLNSGNTKKYPLCMLCLENLGFSGRINYPARQTLRYVPLKLNRENWFMQYSPYAYYEEHLICINQEHTPMKINAETFIKLFDFIDYFPHYFIGSNAALPIVGGSILNHEHFQGGLPHLPMMKTGVLQRFEHLQFPNLRIYEIDWYATSFRCISKNRRDLESFGKLFMNTWNTFSNEACEILSYTDQPHNAITPIAYKNSNDEYVLDIILRNNRQNDLYPDGIFHAHSQYHNLKKEAIGLIEGLGLFILPGRLKKELQEVRIYLKGGNQLLPEDSPLKKHQYMIDQLTEKYGQNFPDEDDYDPIVQYVNESCMHILENISVFKNTPTGRAGFNQFIQKLKLHKYQEKLHRENKKIEIHSLKE